MASARVWSLRDMLDFDGPRFVEAIKGLTVFREWCAVETSLYYDVPPNCPYRPKQLDDLTYIISVCDRLGLDAAQRFAQETKEVLEKQSVSVTGIHTGLCSLFVAIDAQLSGRAVYFFSREQSAAFANTQPFGPEVAAKFSSADYDICEAYRCLAYKRWTASVMHAIRAMEAGIRGIARCLGVPDPTRGVDRNWSSIATAIKTKMDSKWTGPDRLGPDYKKFEGIHGALVAFNNPYRNETMHLDAVYVEEDVEYILPIIKGLMQRIAAVCDENGHPKA